MPNLLPPFSINYDFFDSELTSRTYSKYSPLNIQGRKYEHIEISDDGCIYRLKDKEHGDIVSFIIVNKLKLFKSSFLEIKATKSSYPRRKFLSYLFDLLLEEFNQILISDEIHTSPGSKEFWLSIGRKKKYNIYTINIETNYKRKYSSHEEFEIWGLSSDLIQQLNQTIEFHENLLLQPFDTEFQETETLEIEGSEEIDFIIIKESSTSKEILDYYKANKGNLGCKKHIRLVAQKI